MSTTHDSKQFRREVTGQERRFLSSPTSNISLVLRLQGNVSEQSLKIAVKKMLVTYPLFGVRLEWEVDGVHWSTTEGAAEVPIKVHARESDSTWFDVLNKEYAIPVRPSIGPLTRIILVKGNAISELIVFCHHIISDGRSLQLALQEILLHLGDSNREPPIVPEAPPMTPEIFPEGTSMSKLRAFMIKRINKKWEKEKVEFDEEDLQNIWESVWKNTRYGVEIIEFNEDETQRMIEISRSNDVTLNSTLLIAFAKARIDTVSPDDTKLKIATTVDARKRLSVDCSDSVGFYAGGSFFKFDFKEGISLWDNVRNYHKAVSKELIDNKIFGTVVDHFILDQTLVDAITYSITGNQVEQHQSRYQKLSEYAGKKDGLAAKFTERMLSNSPEVLSTNLGKIDFLYEIPGLQVDRVFFLPTSALGMDIVLGIATASNKLTITLNYYHGYVDGERIRKVRDKAEEILRAILKEE
jgi:NRPS condensation-like uncharacterized protein